MIYRRVGKRAFDLVCAAAGIVLLSPLLLALAVWVKADSPGPVLFRQKRVGKDKTLFCILKFRTMYADTPKDVPTHLLKDPQAMITRSGRFLRRTSLDELPQLFNILAGQMSVVGPRPALWNQDDLIAERDKYGANSLVPGLTGWAQAAHPGEGRAGRLLCKAHQRCAGYENFAQNGARRGERRRRGGGRHPRGISRKTRHPRAQHRQEEAMMKRVGILTSGGDCPGLNATIRGAAKALYQRFGSEVEIVGIQNGYDGLIKGEWREMQQHEFSGILTVGGTILGTKRTPFKMMKVVEGDNVDKVAAMKKTYRDARLDCLLCLGGNGTHKTANLLCEDGLNIIGLPKTIDNDIYGTDVTFGFHTAVDIATEVIDRIHTTASSHRRCMVIEIMGNKAGWLTLYSGIAGGADIILIPELPYNIENVVDAIKRRSEQGKTFSIIAVAEGAYDVAEAAMKKKERAARRAERGERTATSRIARQVEQMTGFETRVCIPGHMQRGGSPSAYDRVLATEFGTYAAKLIEADHYGVAVAMRNNIVTSNPLKDIAGKTKLVPETCDMLTVARRMGISLG